MYWLDRVEKKIVYSVELLAFIGKVRIKANDCNVVKLIDVLLLKFCNFVKAYYDALVCVVLYCIVSYRIPNGKNVGISLV